MKTFSAIEAMTVMRFFVRLEQQMDIAWHEQRYEDHGSLARLSGALSMRIFGVSRWNPASPLADPEFQVYESEAS
jgi:hypothetical protein